MQIYNSFKTALAVIARAIPRRLVYVFFMLRGEAALIERIARAVPCVRGAKKSGAVTLGIGDDAALLSIGRGSAWAVSCDPFFENVHFLSRTHSPDCVGYKSLARATSDLAAMGAAPRYFLLSLALPARRTGAWLDRFLRGLARAAREFHMRLIGGDVAKNSSIVVNITVFGEASSRGALTRSGARPGDWIFVSGRLGLAQLGLELVLRGLHHRKNLRPLMRRHFYPAIRIELGRWLAERGFPSAMMDLSDGLSTDLARLCAASGVGARVELAALSGCAVPVNVLRRVTKRGLDPIQLALHGGEDYELLFTVPPRLAKKIPAMKFGLPLTCIGRIARARDGLRIIHPNGHSENLIPRGWDPFR